MIRMNPKFKTKVKELIQPMEDIQPIFRNIDPTSIDEYKPDSVIYDTIITKLITNEGKLKITDDIYMVGDVMYYLPKTGAAYTIPKTDWVGIFRNSLLLNKVQNMIDCTVAYSTNQYLLDVIPDITSTYKRNLKNKALNILRKKSGTIYKQAMLSEKGDLYSIINLIKENVLSSDFQKLREETTDIAKEEIDKILNEASNYYIPIYLIGYSIYLSKVMDEFSSINNVRVDNLLDISVKVYFLLQSPYLGMSEYIKGEVNKDAGYKLLTTNDDSIKNYDHILNGCERVYKRALRSLRIENNTRQMLIYKLLNSNQFLPISAIRVLNNADNNPEIIFDEFGITNEKNQNLLSYFRIYNSEIEVERYFNQSLASSKSEIVCGFKSEKWKDRFKDLFNMYSDNTFSKKINDKILSASFKEIDLFYPLYTPASNSIIIEEYAFTNLLILDPKNEEDEEHFNHMMERLKYDVMDSNQYNLIYNELYDSFYSKEHTFAIASISVLSCKRVCLLCLDDYKKSYILGIRATIYDNEKDEITELEKETIAEHEAFDDYDKPTQEMSIHNKISLHILTKYGYNAYMTDSNICLDKYKDSNTLNFIKFTIWYYIDQLCNYLNDKQKDNSIDLHLVEVEKTTDKKRKSTEFTVHERKASWIRAHYRHYKSGVVTLVTAHSRKGTNVRGDQKLILTL